MSEPSGDRPAGSSGATPPRRGPRRRRQPAGYGCGYFVGACGHRVPLVEFTPSGYYVGPCPEGCNDPQ
ncbi:MAG: hypothetical protein ACRDQU_08955 [Pseudonocardiaceae bacterium]